MKPGRIFITVLVLLGYFTQVSLAAPHSLPGDEQAEYRSLLPFIMFNYTQGPGSVTGVVFDATKPGRQGVENVKVCYETVCMTTGSDGAYQLDNIPDGLRQIHAEALELFFPAEEAVAIRPFETVQQDIALVPKSGINDVFMRILLTWIETPTWPPEDAENDLDAHLWLVAPEEPYHYEHIYSYFPDNGDCTTFPNACGEVDYRRGYGPETMAIQQLESTVYYFGVLNYNYPRPGVPEIVDLQAKVRVFQEDGVIFEAEIPTEGQGDFWYVFQITSDGVTHTLSKKNCIITYDGTPGTHPECPVEAPPGMK